jgi:uncharacterized repeat protein (TIGR01451 family)
MTNSRNFSTWKRTNEKMKRKIFVVLLAFTFSAMALLAENEQRPELTLTLSVQKKVEVTGNDGKPKTEWREVQSTLPNDVLRYTIKYENKGKAEAKNAKIVDAIPPNTAYLSDSAQGENTSIMFSIDGKNFQTPTLLKYRTQQSNGSEIEHVATPDMYSHIQWIVTKPIPSGGSGSVSFSVLVK